MRGSAWTLPALAAALWLAAILWPALAAGPVVLADEAGRVTGRGAGELLLRSSAWGSLAALGAMILGWGPGRLLGAAAAGRRSIALMVLTLAPICLPAYVIFFAWWQAWPVDSWIARWAIEHGRIQMMREATLLLGFLCWSWPIVAWCVAGQAASTPAEREEMLALDGAGFLARWSDRLRIDGRGLIVGGLIVFLATFNNTTVFDLAEIFTFGNELRAIEALGGTNRDVLAAAAPATALTALGAVCVWFMLTGDAPGGRAAPLRPITVHAGWLVFTIGLLLISVALPLGLLVRGMRLGAGGRPLAAQIDEFIAFYGSGLLNTLGVALITGALAAVIAVGLAWMWQDRRPWVRALASAQAIGWIIAAAVPGTMVGVAMRAAYNRPAFLGGIGLDEIIYRQPAVLVLGHLARFAFIGALLGRWLAASEPQHQRDLRAIDGAETFAGLFRATRPRILAAGCATMAIVLVLALSEIPVTAAVRPAGFDLITPSILNDMHYQRPQTVMLATAVFMTLALLAAAATIIAWRPLRAGGIRR